MSILDFFRNAPAQQNQQQQNINTAIPAQAPPMLQNPGPNGLSKDYVPATTSQDQQETTLTPMEEMINLWKTVPAKETFNPFEAPKFDVNPDDINKAVAGIDFTKSITPEQMTAINAGGADAFKAMMQVMNSIGQQSLAQSSIANTKVIENALAAYSTNVQKSVPDAIKKANMSTAIRGSNPLFDNPATKPMMQVLEKQLISAFPNATSEQISEKAKSMLETFVGEIKGTQPNNLKNANESKEPDWDSYFKNA